MIPILWSEVLQCARQLERTRAFTLPAVAGLAVGIGAATAIFSVCNTLLLGSMGFSDIGGLVSLWPTDVQRGQKHVEVSYGDLVDWRRQASLLEDAALASSVNLDFALTGDGAPIQVESMIVTGNFFRLLGARPGEIGIRLAVGASPLQMVRMVTVSGLRLTAIGAAMGIAAAWLVTRLYTSLLFQVSALD